MPDAGRDPIRILRAREREKYDEEYFEHHYWREDLPGRTGNRGLSYNDPEHKSRFRFLADLLSANVRFRSLVDIGCGLGGLVEVLVQRGYSASGFDVSKVAVARASLVAPGRIWRASADAIPLPDRSVDIAFCSDVLEHLLACDVQAAVSELARVASAFVIATVNLDNPYEYHPTILSRSQWDAFFLSTGLLRPAEPLRSEFQCRADDQHPEYDFFAYERI